MVVQSSSSPRWQVDEVTEKDAPQVCDLYKQVFKEEMSLPHWRWKYGEGRGAGVVVRSNERVIAHYGGIVRRIRYLGEPSETMQCVDTMVIPGHRGSLTRKGPYYLAATTFLRRYVGYDLPYPVGFGFPNARVMRLGEHLGVQADIGSVVGVSWQADYSSKLTSAIFDFESPGHQRVLSAAWGAMAADLTDRIVIDRDLEYLRYRYREHPRYQYEIHLVMHSNSKIPDNPLGLMVTRVENQRLMLMDLIGATANFPDLIRFGRSLANERGCEDLYGWLTEVDCRYFDNSGLTVHDIGVRIPTSVCSAGPPPAELQDAWFLMTGDTDFL